jgi:hypothetical protein
LRLLRLVVLCLGDRERAPPQLVVDEQREGEQHQRAPAWAAARARAQQQGGDAERDRTAAINSSRWNTVWARPGRSNRRAMSHNRARHDNREPAVELTAATFSKRLL